MNCLGSLFGSKSSAPCSGPVVAPPTATVLSTMTVVQATSANQSYLLGLERELRGMLGAKSANVSINKIVDPMQPNV